MPKRMQTEVAIVSLNGLRAASPAKARARAPMARRAAMARGVKAPAALAAPTPDAGDALSRSLAGQQLELVSELPFVREATPRPSRGTKRTRRSAARAAAPSRTTGDRPGLTLDVKLADGEEAVILLEEDGVFSWHLRSDDVTPPAAHHAMLRQRAAVGRRPAKGTPRQRVKRFTLTLPPVPVEEPTPRAVSGRSRGLKSAVGGFIAGKVVARVFRFVAGAIVGPVIHHMERNIRTGLVWMGDTDCSKWRLMDESEQLTLRADRPARVLLWFHGTFSSTMGSFGGLSATPHGKALLKKILSRYDAVVGFDHATMSVDPMQNASAVLARLERQKWSKPPVFDAVCFSRGGLVFRSLVESALPASNFKYSVEKAIFVASTNGGTELARRKNWDRFIDRYTNLASAACTAIGFVTASSLATKILGEAIKGVSALVKALAVVALDENGVPGLEAMDPSGAFVRTINDLQAGQPQPATSYYCVITSNFDPDKAQKNKSLTEFPAAWWLRLADKPVDELINKQNDLVVDVPSMSAIDPGVGEFVKQQYDFGTNGAVYHTNYFLQKDTATELSEWLKLDAPAPPAALQRQKKSSTVSAKRRRSRAR